MRENCIHINISSKYDHTGLEVLSVQVVLVILSPGSSVVLYYFFPFSQVLPAHFNTIYWSEDSKQTCPMN